MPTDEELDAMAMALYGVPWTGGKLAFRLGFTEKVHVMQCAIAAKHAKAACDLAEDSANYMARLVL